MKPTVRFMRLALREAGKNLRELTGGPFGACIVRDDRVIAVARNTVLKNDATCHAEVNAIRLASRKLKTHRLAGTQIYSTTEPCPMCFAAIHWAGIEIVIYGTSIADARRRGFNELTISNRQMKSLGHSAIRLTPGFLRAECLQLLNAWDHLPKKPIY